MLVTVHRKFRSSLREILISNLKSQVYNQAQKVHIRSHLILPQVSTMKKEKEGDQISDTTNHTRTNLNGICEFEMAAAISDFSTSGIFTCFSQADLPPLSYCFLRININRIENCPFLYVWDFSIHLLLSESNNIS